MDKKLIAFVKQHSNEILEAYSQYGKVNGVGVCGEGICVNFESLVTTLTAMPKKYKGYPVVPKKVGKIRPLRN